MGQYTKLIKVNPSELNGLTEERLYRRFFPNNLTSGDELFDLDKSLPGIHFLLSGDGYSQYTSQSLLKGTDILPYDSGAPGSFYRLLMPEEIKVIDQFLFTVNDSLLEQNFDPLLMMAADIYPNIWDRGKESYDYLHTHFAGLKAFISRAAKSNMAVIVMTS